MIDINEYEAEVKAARENNRALYQPAKGLYPNHQGEIIGIIDPHEQKTAKHIVSDIKRILKAKVKVIAGCEEDIKVKTIKHNNSIIVQLKYNSEDAILSTINDIIAYYQTINSI